MSETAYRRGALLRSWRMRGCRSVAPRRRRRKREAEWKQPVPRLAVSLIPKRFHRDLY